MPHKPPPFDNHGVLEGRRGTDFAGGVLPYQERLPSGNWEPYAPTGEKQHSNNTDTMGCVSFSAINSIEMQEKFLTGVQPNYSDRWIAKMSGTTQMGNWLYIVADTIRKYGLVLEEDYPAPANYTWDSYYAPIPPAKLAELKAKGQAWLQKWQVDYEWVDVFFQGLAEIVKQLKQAPLQVVIPGHAIVEIRNEAALMKYFDTYNPFIKGGNQNAISSALKILLTPKKGYSMAKVLNDNGTIRLEFGSGPSGFNIGIASSSLFQQIQASDEPVFAQAATTPEKLTLSDGMVLHNK